MIILILTLTKKSEVTLSAFAIVSSSIIYASRSVFAITLVAIITFCSKIRYIAICSFAFSNSLLYIYIYYT